MLSRYEERTPQWVQQKENRVNGIGKCLIITVSTRFLQDCCSNWDDSQFFFSINVHSVSAYACIPFCWLLHLTLKFLCLQCFCIFIYYSKESNLLRKLIYEIDKRRISIFDSFFSTGSVGSSDRSRANAKLKDSTLILKLLIIIDFASVKFRWMHGYLGSRLICSRVLPANAGVFLLSLYSQLKMSEVDGDINVEAFAVAIVSRI